jgi:putative PEP-CTERM system histidine kinase
MEARLLILLPLASGLLAVVLAATVLRSDPRGAPNRWLALGLVLLTLRQSALGLAALAGPGSPSGLCLRLALAAGVALPPVWLGFSFRFAPALRPVRWRPVGLALLLAAAAAWGSLAAGRGISFLHLGTAGTVEVGLDAWGKAMASLSVVGLSLVLLQFENLYRQADRLTRWRIKFLVVGTFVGFACEIVADSYAVLYGHLPALAPLLGSIAFLVGEGMIAFSLVRHRLLAVDLFVSRYVIYRSVTLALIVGYLVTLGAAAELFTWLEITLDLLTGVVLASLGAAALALLLLSEEVQRRLRRAIHTHFYKYKYDYRDEWMEFTARRSRATAVPEIAAQTVTRILEVMWLRRAAMYALGESPDEMSLAHQVEYETLPPTLHLSVEAQQSLREQAGPGAGSASTPVFSPLLDLLPASLPVGALVPVMAMDTLVGLLVVGPESSGQPFGQDDHDLLVAVAAQAGALLVNARLARQAAEGREMQALARLSAFITHDLKNAVTVLALLSQNARHHLGNPAFQADAIDTLDQVTARMRRLLARLAQPGAADIGEPRAIDLAPALEAWLRDLQALVPARIQLETALAWAGTVWADPDVLRSVLQNLLLNAVEAIPAEGQIRVTCGLEAPDAVLVVADTGRGMSADFVRQRLFRPFQTTKARGLGIGLYQCRHLLRTLGGSLGVDSQEGAGTRMIVRLPVIPSTERTGTAEAAPAGAATTVLDSCLTAPGSALGRLR